MAWPDLLLRARGIYPTSPPLQLTYWLAPRYVVAWCIGGVNSSYTPYIIIIIIDTCVEHMTIHACLCIPPPQQHTPLHMYFTRCSFATEVTLRNFDLTSSSLLDMLTRAAHRLTALNLELVTGVQLDNTGQCTTPATPRHHPSNATPASQSGGQRDGQQELHGGGQTLSGGPLTALTALRQLGLRHVECHSFPGVRRPRRGGCCCWCANQCIAFYTLMHVGYTQQSCTL